MTHMLPSRFAVVVMPPDVPEPTRGSVRPKHPIFSHRAIGGGQVLFFFFPPPPKIDPTPRPLCRPKKESIYSSKVALSISITPNTKALPPLHPYPLISSL